MKVQSQIIRASAVTAMALAICAGVNAGDVNVFASLAIKPVIEAIGPSFEKASGHKLVTRFELTPAVKRQIEAGEAFDVAIANPPHIEDLIKQGKIVAGSRADIARFGVGVGVRAGAPRPDVSSVDALKRTLLATKTLAYVGEGTSGVAARSPGDCRGDEGQVETGRRSCQLGLNRRWRGRDRGHADALDPQPFRCGACRRAPRADPGAHRHDRRARRGRQRPCRFPRIHRLPQGSGGDPSDQGQGLRTTDTVVQRLRGGLVFSVPPD